MFAVIRAIRGPTVFDRVLASNSIGTLAILLLASYGFLTDRPEFLDIGLTYGLLNLIGTFAVLKFFRHGDLATTSPKTRRIGMEMIADAISWGLIVLGSFFLVTGALGMLRMPDVYTRMHAASVIDTLGATLLILGLVIQAGLTLVALKLLFVLALMFFFGPVASHALAQAALHATSNPSLPKTAAAAT